MSRLLLTLLVFAAPTIARAQTFRRPVACDSCIANWYYFDEDASGGTQDWNCGTSTYNGHRGSDFSLAGGNGAIDTGWDITAVADGTVTQAEDGHFDHCSTCDATVDSRCGLGIGSGFGNHITVDHGTHTVVYAHMRTGSVRVAVGDHVTCGQVVGQIGSSGCTTGAHVHVEPRPLHGGYLTAFDPFAGGCSPTTPSLWTSQGPWRGMPDPLCDGTPPPPVCPSGTYAIWTCDTARTQRERCISGVDMIDVCRWGSCISMPVGVDDLCPAAPDADGDGSAADVDCNDADASVHPGATDVCGDGLDQDCVGGDAICATDGGTPIDAGPGLDSGSASDGGGRPDGGVRDAAPTTDAADGGAHRVLNGGCGCSVIGTSDPTLLFFVLCTALFTRRRPRRFARAPHH